MKKNSYILSNLFPADEALLLQDVYLVILHANHIPPHLAVSVNGKLFTLTVKGATVDGDLYSLLRLIKKNNIGTIFIRLHVPALFTIDQLREEIKKHTLAYPRVDIGIATCLHPIRDFCSQVYDKEAKKANFIFELLPRLESKQFVEGRFYLNMKNEVKNNSFVLNTYTMHDIYEGIREIAAV